MRFADTYGQQERIHMFLALKVLGIGLVVTFMVWVTVTDPTPYGAPIGCFTTIGPVPALCVENYNTPRCATEDGNDGVSDCWWIDPKDQRVWYQPK